MTIQMTIQRTNSGTESATSLDVILSEVDRPCDQRGRRIRVALANVAQLATKSSEPGSSTIYLKAFTEFLMKKTALLIRVFDLEWQQDHK